MKIGTKVEITHEGPPATNRCGERGEVVEVRKYIETPYVVRLEGGHLYHCGPYDVRRLA